MGYILAMAGMREEKNVTCLPSYGAQVRGGVANCTVVISDEEIASPVASEPEFAVLMNNPALFQYQNLVQSGGTLFLNSSLIETKPIRGDLQIHEIPANSLAQEHLKEDKVSNMVMLGAFTKKTGLVSLDTVALVLKEVFSTRAGIIKLNKSALVLGYDYIS